MAVLSVGRHDSGICRPLFQEQRNGGGEMRKLMSNRPDVCSDCARPLSAKSKSVRIPAFSEFSWIWVGLILLFSVSSVVAPGTMTRGSILAMLPFAGILAIVATGQTLVIQQRGLDMSSAGMLSLAGVLVARTGFGFDSIVL